MRKKLISPNDESAVAAIEVLNYDKESIGARIAVAVDKQRAVPVRKSALQSLMHDHSADAIDALLSVFFDGETDVDLRSEAIAAARVNLELGRRFASQEQIGVCGNSGYERDRTRLSQDGLSEPTLPGGEVR